MKLNDYWARDYTGRPFQLFGPAHLTVLLGVAALNVGWVWLGPLLNDEVRATLRLAMAAVLLLNESVYHLWNWRTGQWTPQTMLPLHLCSVLVYLSAFMLITRNYTVYEFCYFLGVGGALQALLTPDAGRYGFPHVRFFTTMVSHSLLFSAPLYLTVVEGYRPTWNSVLVVVAGTALYALIVGLANWRLGSNYMYLARKPDTPSLIDRLGPWPWYIGWLAAFAIGMFLILYLPFALWS
jgi:hypothetical integral membrane protein (TIGR02206 family)